MSAGRWNAIIEQGATFSYRVTLSKTGVTLAASDYQARMQVRNARNNALIANLTSSPAAGLTVGDDDGALTIDIFIDSAETALMHFETGFLKFDIEDSSGFVSRLLAGDVYLSRPHKPIYSSESDGNSVTVSAEGYSVVIGDGAAANNYQFDFSVAGNLIWHYIFF